MNVIIDLLVGAGASLFMIYKMGWTITNWRWWVGMLSVAVIWSTLVSFLF